MNTMLIDTPIGKISLTADNNALHFLDFGVVPRAKEGSNRVLLLAKRELEEYFSGHRTEFTVPLKTSGTPFREKVWAALRSIPYGQTRSYSEVAAMIGNPHACRAVGGANHANPIAIIIPCHRVISADGSLGGFGGGPDVKQALLSLEGKKILSL